MFALLDIGLARELQAILTLYLGTVLIGISIGFSAVAIPDIKEEMRQELFDQLMTMISVKSLSEKMGRLPSSRDWLRLKRSCPGLVRLRQSVDC